MKTSSVPETKKFEMTLRNILNGWHESNQCLYRNESKLKLMIYYTAHIISNKTCSSN